MPCSTLVCTHTNSSIVKHVKHPILLYTSSRKREAQTYFWSHFFPIITSHFSFYGPIVFQKYIIRSLTCQMSLVPSASRYFTSDTWRRVTHVCKHRCLLAGSIFFNVCVKNIALGHFRKKLCIWTMSFFCQVWAASSGVGWRGNCILLTRCDRNSTNPQLLNKSKWRNKHVFFFSICTRPLIRKRTLLFSNSFWNSIISRDLTCSVWWWNCTIKKFEILWWW